MPNPDLRLYPYWPAVMDLETASNYLSLSASTFRAVAARADIHPIDLGVRLLRYRRTDLDRMIQQTTDRTPAEPSHADDRRQEQALARVSRRSRRP
jgi:hypothetical protein